jgi:tetratricopeptide (TPR) repeat protein
MKSFLKTTGVTIVIALIVQTLINFGIIDFNKDDLDYEELQKILGNSSNTEEEGGFQEEPDLPGQEYDDSHLQKGDEYLEKGLQSLAMTEYVESAKKQNDNPEAFTKIGKIHFENGETQKARENFVKAIQLNPNFLEARIYLGRSYLKENNFDKAKEIFGNITAENQMAKYYRGLIASFYGEHEAAKSLLAETISIDTSDETTDKAKVVLKAYEEFARNQGGQDMHLKTILCRAYNQVEEYNMAIPVLFEILKEQKDYRDAWIILGYSYLNTEKTKDAIYAFETARKLDPQKPETLYFLGLANFAENNLQNAIALIEQAVENGFEPQIQANQKLAEIYLLNSQFSEAAEKYERIVEVNDIDVNSYVRPVWLYIDKLKNPEKAIVLAQRAVEHHPESAMSYNLLGWAYVASDDLTEGKDNLLKALEIDPSLEAAYLNLGWMYEKKGLLSLAKKNYEKAKDEGKNTSVANLAQDRYNRIIQEEESLAQTFKADITSPATTETDAGKVGTKFILPKITKKQ